VVAMLTVFAVMDATTRPDVERTANGFDVVVQAAGSDGVRVPETVDAEVRRSVTLAHRTYVGPVGGDDPFAAVERVSHPLYRASPDLADQPPLRLASRDDRYADDAAVWRAVATDPTLTVSSLGAVGSIVTLRGDAGPVRLTVAGTPPVGLLGGAFLSDRALRAFGAAAAGITVLLDVRSPSAADAVARAMQQSVADRGGRAVSVLALLESAALADRAFQDMITVLMRMGLLVGVLGLGIVALRVATERRQVIGILRAIGYRRRDVALSLLVESAVVTTLGTVVGVVTGLAMGYALSRGSGSGAFGIDIGLIGGVLAVVYLAAFAVTVLPAWQASRLPPARAVRLGS
jgi:hypothetical protein